MMKKNKIKYCNRKDQKKKKKFRTLLFPLKKRLKKMIKEDQVLLNIILSSFS